MGKPIRLIKISTWDGEKASVEGLIDTGSFFTTTSQDGPAPVGIVEDGIYPWGIPLRNDPFVPQSRIDGDTAVS